ncbi:CPBP family intramembrane glutamic endopeptidase [Salegentibacter chungangensis]|uniref:CPBP family intramembrane glutamic endopeptidase n=1 Tax=Salegentibacter chungangensis TaxID=1335724 RepID=A0ABW3NR60_9FLAO
MFIQQAFKYRYDFWRYLLGIFIVFIGITLGQIPLVVMAMLEKGGDVMMMDENEMLSILDSNLTLFLMLLTFAVGLVFLLVHVKVIHKQSVLSLTTSRKRIDWSRFWFAFILIAVFTIVITLLDYFTNPGDYLVNFQLEPFLILVGVAVLMMPLQTAFEEYFFRAYLMQGIGVLAKNRWLPLFITSIVFGGLHFFNPEVGKLGNIVMIHYIGTGFMLGIITLMDDGLELALGFHTANNLVAALLVTADWTAFKTNSIFKDVSDPSAGWDVIIPVFIVYPIFLYILGKRYGWTNWNQKLFGKVEKAETLNLSEEA